MSDQMQMKEGKKRSFDRGIWVGLPPSGWNSVKGLRNVENDCHEIGLGVRGQDGFKGHLLDHCQSWSRLESSHLCLFLPLNRNYFLNVIALLTYFPQPHKRLFCDFYRCSIIKLA